MAGLALAPEQRSTGELELFFDLQLGSLARFTDNPIEGSAIRTKLPLSAGTELSFDFFFDAGDQSPRNDCALFVIGDRVFKLSDIVATGNDGASGWRTFVYKVPTSGVFTIGFATLNDRVDGNPSPLYVDNVRLNRLFGGDYVVAEDDPKAGWRILVQQPTLRDDALLTNEDSLVTTTAQALFGNDTSVATASGPLRIIGLNREGAIGHPDFSSDGIIAYDPRGRFDRLAEGEIASDTFRYEVASDNGSTTLGTVRVTVTGRNDAPTAVADFEAVAANADHVTLDVLANDDDVDSDDSRTTLRIVAAEAASGAEVTFSGQPGAGIVYRPDGRFASLGVGEAANDTITYTVVDRHGTPSTATVTIKITGVNDAPLAHDDEASTDEDNAVFVRALANDTDPDSKDALHVSKVDGVTEGAIVTLREDGRLAYDPGSAFNHLGAGQTATDSFSYEIDDGHGGTSAARVTVTVAGHNDAPAAAADQAMTGEKARLTLAAGALLANDSDPDAGDTLRLIAVDGAGARGTVSLRDGTVTYDPSGHFAFLGEGETATETFCYVVADGAGASATGSVDVAVAGVNDPVDARDDTSATGEDARLTVATPGVLANDVDPDVNDKHTVIAVDGLAANVGRPITLASGAQLTLNASGSLLYDAGSAWNFLSAGEQRFETIGYTVSDGHASTDSAQVTITINGANDAPSTTDDSAVTDEDSKRRIAVLANDSDPDAGDRLSVRTIILQGPDGTPTLGSVRVNVDNTLTYDPEGRFDRLLSGETATDTFQYVGDAHGGRTTSTVTVAIHGVENPQTILTQELLDSFDDPLFTPFSVHGLTANFGLRGTGDLQTTFVPKDALGRDLIPLHPTHLGQMAVLEGSGSSTPQIESYLSNEVLAGGRPLVKLPDDVDYSSPNAGAATRTQLVVTGNDLVDGRILLASDWNFVANRLDLDRTGSGINDFGVLTVTDGTTAKVFKLSDARTTDWGASGWRTSIYDITHDFAFNAYGEIHLTVGFAVLNDANQANPAHLLLDNIRLNRLLGADFELVSGAGSAFETYRQSPTALPDALAATEDAPLIVTAQALLANDIPARGIDASTLRITGIDGTDTQGVVTLANGQVTYDPRGRLDFLAEGQIGADTFRYAVTDAIGGTDQGEVTVRATGLNDAPVASLDTVSAVENGAPITVDVLANDDDIDSDDDRGTLRIVAASAGSGAVVTFAGAAGVGIVYHPGSTGAFDELGAGETGVDTISYTIEDGHGSRASGSVSVLVAGRNDAPTATPDQSETDEDTPVTLAVLSNDTDPDLRDRLSMSAINGTAITPGASIALASGAIVIANPEGTLRYDPAAGFSHLARGQTTTDTFSYTAADGHGGAGTATVLVTINGRNDAPVAGTDVLTTDASTRLTVAASTLLSNDTDPDAGDGIALIGIDAGSTLGSVNFGGTAVTYDPNGRFRGLGEGETAADSFAYRIADHDGSISTASVAVTIHGLNDTPTASDNGGSTDEDTPLTLHVLADDTDPDVHDTLTVTSINTSSTRGQVTLNADGSITYDPRGRFDSLDAGQTDHDSFTYRVSDGHGGTDDATVTVAISGEPDTDRLVDSFETAFLSQNRTSSVVTTVGQYQESDGAHGLYRPTDGQFMAKLEAYGTTAQKVGSETISKLENFLGIPDRSLPKDSVDNTFPANGSAFKLKVSVQAGDEISFDWMFDARDFVNSPPDGKADDDFAIFTVAGGAGPELFKLSDIRQTGDQGATGWRSSIYKASAAADLTIGFGVVNDRIADAPREHNSFLLVDSVRLNRDFDQGYQLVDHQADGRFETVVHT